MIVADGIIIDGTSIIDYSSLTGASLPVSVSHGDIISGGSINCSHVHLIIQTIINRYQYRRTTRTPTYQPYQVKL
jgi:cation transport ATPase